LIAGWQCRVCGATVDIAAPFAWKCPNATTTDRHHALRLVQGNALLQSGGQSNPFIAFRPYLAWDAFVGAHGLTVSARDVMVGELDSLVASVAGTGFVETPMERADELSDALGFGSDGGVWVKDETRNVAGSHKARHLFTILLHLRAAEQLGLAQWEQRPPLAIASCGNAALAAATLAAAVSWPIRVFVPPSANLHVTKRLSELGAMVVECPRVASDPAGDPCVHRFREAVAAGAIPFSVQGTENAWCLDGGRTLGWEMAGSLLRRVFVQVGGGAFAASVAAGVRDGGSVPQLHAVQTEACAPLARAWGRSRTLTPAEHWSECMWPWEHVGESAADGILDDETYDWLPVVEAMDATGATGGSPVVVTEAQVLAANELGCRATGIDASHTGTAGLAGLLAIRDQIDPDERVAVIFSGIRR
jgi:threonine dehydratase